MIAAQRRRGADRGGTSTPSSAAEPAKVVLTDQEWCELAAVVHVIRPRLAARAEYARASNDERADLELAELERMRASGELAGMRPHTDEVPPTGGPVT